MAALKRERAKNAGDSALGTAAETDDGFGARLSALLDQRGLKQKDLAEMTGIPQSTISVYVRGADPSRQALVAIARALDVSLDWLATGRGGMDWKIAVGQAVPLFPNEVGDYVALPERDVRAGGGSGAAVDNERVVGWVLFERAWLKRELRVDLQHLSIIRAAGHSMEPTVDDGDYLIVDHSQAWFTIDGLYVLGVGDDLYVKRVTRGRGDKLLVSSDNPQYAQAAYSVGPDQTESLRIVGRVVWHGGRV